MRDAESRNTLTRSRSPVERGWVRRIMAQISLNLVRKGYPARILLATRAVYKVRRIAISPCPSFFAYLGMAGGATWDCILTDGPEWGILVRKYRCRSWLTPVFRRSIVERLERPRGEAKDRCRWPLRVRRFHTEALHRRFSGWIHTRIGS